MKYYIVWCTGNVTYKVIAKDREELLDKVKKEISEQNKGEAKSDKIHYKRHWEVNKIAYDDFSSVPIL